LAYNYLLLHPNTNPLFIPPQRSFHAELNEHWFAREGKKKIE